MLKYFYHGFTILSIEIDKLFYLNTMEHSTLAQLVECYIEDQWVASLSLTGVTVSLSKTLDPLLSTG